MRVWRSLWGWYRWSVSFGKDFVEVLCDRFPIQQFGSRYSIVVGQNDTQCFLHQNVLNFYYNVSKCQSLQLDDHFQTQAVCFYPTYGLDSQIDHHRSSYDGCVDEGITLFHLSRRADVLTSEL